MGDDGTVWPPGDQRRSLLAIVGHPTAHRMAQCRSIRPNTVQVEKSWATGPGSRDHSREGSPQETGEGDLTVTSLRGKAGADLRRILESEVGPEPPWPPVTKQDQTVEPPGLAPTPTDLGQPCTSTLRAEAGLGEREIRPPLPGSFRFQLPSPVPLPPAQNRKRGEEGIPAQTGHPAEPSVTLGSLPSFSKGLACCLL